MADKAARAQGGVPDFRRRSDTGGYIVFHDSLKAQVNLKEALPRAIEWLKSEGYEFLSIPM